MQNLAERRRDTRRRWLALVESTTARLDELVDAFLAEVRAASTYETGLIDDEELRETAVSSIGLILRAVSSETPVSELGPVPAELGRRRARQGVPADDLVAAVRIDFNVIWSALLWQATVPDMAVLALHVDELWAVVDEYARSVQNSHHEERAVMSASMREEQQAYLAELFAPGGSLPIRISRIARALDVDPHALFRVAALDETDSDAAHRAARRAEASHAQMYVVRRPGHVVVFWPADDVSREGHLVERQTTALDGVNGGLLLRVDGLAQVPAAVQPAVDILRLTDSSTPGLRTVEDRWAQLSKAHLDSGQRFTATVRAELDELSEPDRVALLDTVGAYLDSGSVNEAARHSFCHRNTVLNRIARFKNLTGLDITVPRDAALAVLLLA